MVENKDDFGNYEGVDSSSDVDVDMNDDPPLVDATIAHPEPSAPVEEAPPTYDEAISVTIDEQSENTGQAPPVPNENFAQTEAERQMVASGTTAAVFGFLFLGGPIGAAILGCSAAYASQKEGAAGDIARSVGDIGISIKAKARQINDKHHIVDRSSKAATEAWQSAMEYDREHRVLEKLWIALQYGWQSFTKFVQDHRLLERGVETAGRGYEFIAERVAAGNGTATPTTTTTTTTENTPRPPTSQYQRIPGTSSKAY